jgi:hypothetical protein
MSVVALAGIRKAVQNLNPGKVRELGERELNIALYAHTNEAYRRMEDFFLNGLHERRRRESLEALTRGPAPEQALKFDLAIYDEGVVAPARGLVFHQREPDLLVKRILSKHDDLGVPLARHFEVFRKPYVEHLIKKISRENALFSLATALPDIIPSFIELPWAIAEFTSDTAFITMNQIRMAFLLAAASDRQVGYLEQKSEIAGVIGSAFGWRALARQVAGKIPFGGGLIPKAGIAYAGTRVLGASIERFYRIGYAYTREERESMYSHTFEQGKKVAKQILRTVRPDLADKLRDDDQARPTERRTVNTEASAPSGAGHP